MGLWIRIKEVLVLGGFEGFRFLEEVGARCSFFLSGYRGRWELVFLGEGISFFFFK